MSSYAMLTKQHLTVWANTLARTRNQTFPPRSRAALRLAHQWSTGSHPLTTPFPLTSASSASCSAARGGMSGDARPVREKVSPSRMQAAVQFLQPCGGPLLSWHKRSISHLVSFIVVRACLLLRMLAGTSALSPR
eukprot:1144255-Pelagomonas_calceolata.AAC.4